MAAAILVVLTQCCCIESVLSSFKLLPVLQTLIIPAQPIQSSGKIHLIKQRGLIRPLNTLLTLNNLASLLKLGINTISTNQKTTQ